MIPLRRARWWFVAILILIMPGAVSLWLNYPVAVTFDFDYRGEHHHIAYLTMMKMRFCGDFQCIVEWRLGRTKTSVVLPDGSLIVLNPYWPSSEKKDFGTVHGHAWWIWLDHPTTPTEVVLGQGGEQPTDSDHTPFPTWIVDATIERVSQFHQIKAFIDDRLSYDGDPVVASTRSFRYHQRGRLFAAIEATPITLKPSLGEDASDWQDLDGCCRIIFNVSLTNRAWTSDRSQERYLVRSLSREGDVWSFDQKPGPVSSRPTTLYDTGATLDTGAGGQAISDLVRPALEQVHTLKHEGTVCRISEWPKSGVNALVDFGNGEFFFVRASLNWVTVRE
jgi:hypothetical protein